MLHSLRLRLLLALVVVILVALGIVALYASRVTTASLSALSAAFYVTVTRASISRSSISRNLSPSIAASKIYGPGCKNCWRACKPARKSAMSWLTWMGKSTLILKVI